MIRPHRIAASHRVPLTSGYISPQLKLDSLSVMQTRP